MADSAEIAGGDQLDDHDSVASVAVRRGLGGWPGRGLLLVVCALLGLWLAAAERDDGSDAPAIEQTGGPEARTAGPLGPPPEALVAAERHVADPSGRSLRTLIGAIGGLDALVVGEAEGAFDLVSFDPFDHDRLIASARSSYGRSENQATNELWQIEPDGLDQAPLAPDTPHDFAHFNPDGTITLWVRDGAGASFAPRTAIVTDRDRQPITTTRPLFASRFVAVDGTVFALTNDGDYYSTLNTFDQLVAEGPTGRVLDAGERYAWVATPAPEVLIAYPNDPGEATAAWETATLEPAPDHPLAGRPHRRSAISGDGTVAVGITFDGGLEAIDLTTGRTLSVFGRVDPRGIDRPITINQDGTIAVTVDRSGTTSLWWVGDDEPVATIDADAAQPRWVSARFGAMAASVVTAAADRIALRLVAGPQEPVRWRIVDVGVDRLVAAACAMAGRPLTADERDDLGLDDTVAACV